MWNQLIRVLGGAMTVLALTACGGGDGAAPAPAQAPAPAPSGIGPAGGTVTGANGATLVVPAGALAQTVDLQVTEIAPSAANLPAGVTAVGAVYALTPHGTSFTQPVTVNLPFDPSQVPAGSTVQLLKTTDAARTQWSELAGATVNGGVISAQVTSFSDFLPIAAPMVPPPTGWQSVGAAIVDGTPVRLGGLAVSSSGRVAVAYVAGSSGTAGLVGELRVSEWDGTNWSQVGGALNLTAADGPSLALRSIAYDAQGRIVVAWLDRFTLTLVVQRRNAGVWERLGNPLFSAAAVTASPQIVVDPVSDRPIVVITSGPHVTVREWTGTDWTPSGFSLNRNSLAAAILTVTHSGQRRLANVYGADTGGTQLLARMLAPDASGGYNVEVGGPVLDTPVSNTNFLLDMATDGTSPFMLAGDRAAGPMLVRRWTGAAWETIGGDLGIGGFSGWAQLEVAPSGMPMVGYLKGNSPASRVDAVRWDGTAWAAMASPHPTTVDVAGFALAIAASGVPHVALTQRDATSPSRLSTQLVVRRFAP